MQTNPAVEQNKNIMVQESVESDR